MLLTILQTLWRIKKIETLIDPKQKSQATRQIKKIFIQTFGCQMNVYDSDRIFDSFEAKYQAQRTDDILQADILIANTCSIREKAEEKVFSLLGRWKKIKNNKPELIIAVGGCVASQEGEKIKIRAPYVDIIFGPQTLHRLVDLVENTQKQESPKTQIDISFPDVEKFDLLPKPNTSSVSAYVSIMEGCSKYCSYCVVPYTRGEEINRDFVGIINEVEHLVSQGVVEINLLGQNVNAYYYEQQEEVFKLSDLIYEIAQIDQIQRIRYTTSHPAEFSDDLIEVYAHTDKLVNYLHLPVQSGSNRILQMMKRDYQVETYIDKIKRLREIRPNISISSDFIVGFPGETDEDFEATMDLIHKIQFDQSFSFIYSKRPGTPASDIEDSISIEVKKQRLKILQNRINVQAEEIGIKMIGGIHKVLVTDFSKKDPGKMFGLSENNRRVFFQALDPTLIGRIIEVKIESSMVNALKGKRVES